MATEAGNRHTGRLGSISERRPRVLPHVRAAPRKNASKRTLFNMHTCNEAMQKALYSEEFLEAWKKESDAWVDVIFASVPIEGSVLSGKIKQQAVEAIMRVVWFRIDTLGKEEVLLKNLDIVKKYTADLVDRVVAKDWKRVTASR